MQVLFGAGDGIRTHELSNYEKDALTRLSYTSIINNSMKLKNILEESPLKEAPIPDDWDSSTYNKAVPFAQRIRYAKARAKQVGVGSSRVAFLIDYQGRKTVLKIAKNKKGIAQNVQESQMFSDYLIKDLGITIPMIDYDEDNEDPTWIHLEFAEKMKPNQFKKFFSGISHHEIVYVIEYLTGKKSIYHVSDEDKEHYQQLYEDNKYIDSLVFIAGNYDVPVGDFGSIANWGVYKNQPVIIDLGLSSEVYQKYYN